MAKKKAKKKTKRKCGICRKPGHNRSKCPQRDDVLVQHGSYQEPKITIRERKKPEVTIRAPRRRSTRYSDDPSRAEMERRAEEMRQTVEQRDPTLRTRTRMPASGLEADVSLSGIQILVRFANNLLIALSHGSSLTGQYPIEDRRALCQNMTHELPKLFGGYLYAPTLDLLKELQGASSKQNMQTLLDNIVRLVALYGGEVIIPEIGDTFDYDIHQAVGNHPNITPGRQAVMQVVECGLRFGSYLQPARVLVSQSRRSRRHNLARRRRYRRRNPEDIRQEIVDLFTAHRRYRNPWEAPERCETCFQQPCICPCPECNEHPCACTCVVCGEQPCRCCAMCGHAPRAEGFGAIMKLDNRACRCPCHGYNVKPRQRRRNPQHFCACRQCYHMVDEDVEFCVLCEQAGCERGGMFCQVREGRYTENGFE